jgi:hypothetical protein
MPADQPNGNEDCNNGVPLSETFGGSLKVPNNKAPRGVLISVCASRRV